MEPRRCLPARGGSVLRLPLAGGRIVKVAGKSGVRYRNARYLADGKNIVVLSTESGETEFWNFPANGLGKGEQWTSDAKVLRWDGVPFAGMDIGWRIATKISSCGSSTPNEAAEKNCAVDGR